MRKRRFKWLRIEEQDVERFEKRSETREVGRREQLKGILKHPLRCKRGKRWTPTTKQKKQKEGWEDRVEVSRFENPSCWRMVKAPAGDKEGQDMVEEYLLHIQGILEDKRVPPIRGENNSQKKKQHLRQSVTLGAFNSPKFMEDVDHIMDVVALFARHVPGIQQTAVRQVGEKTVIDIGNRIFTPKHEAPMMQPVEVDRLLDENGYIGL
ncbi:hypothetical protein F5880DRAFT_1510241, partial [Lentinula raphanica]